MEIGSSFTAGVNGFQKAAGRITDETININQQAAEQRNAVDQLATEQIPAQDRQVQETERAAALPTQSKSLESSLVSLTAELYNAKSNVKSIQTADEVLGSVIDLRV